jgi:hypothetical protein
MTVKLDTKLYSIRNAIKKQLKKNPQLNANKEKKVCYLVPVLFFPCTNSEQHLMNLIRIGDVDKGTNPNTISGTVNEEKSYQIP